MPTLTPNPGAPSQATDAGLDKAGLAQESGQEQGSTGLG